MHIDDLFERDEELAPSGETGERWPRPRFFTRAYGVWLGIVTAAALLFSIPKVIGSEMGFWNGLGYVAGKLAIVLALFHIIYAAVQIRAGFAFGVTPLKPVHRDADTRAVYRDDMAELSRTQRDLMDLYKGKNRSD